MADKLSDSGINEVWRTNHHYSYEVRTGPKTFHIEFQCGKRGDPYSRTGITQEDLLEIVRDRLAYFDQRLPDTNTQFALLHVETALEYLRKRKETSSS